MRSWKSWLLGLLCAIALPAHAQTVEYIHTDALGTPVAVTDVNRNVIELSEYEPYGERLATSTPSATKDGPGYTGHVMDASTGLTYMQQRYYDPTLGRFLSVDPVAANSGTGANFNRYYYANNNPYRFIDPDGRRAGDRGASYVGDGLPGWGGHGTGPGSGFPEPRQFPPNFQDPSLQVRPLPRALPIGPSSGAAGSEEIGRRIDRQIERIRERVQGPEAEQYALVAIWDKYYPDVRGGQIRMAAGDVYKYGQTTNPATRYSAAQLRTAGLRYETQFVGTQRDVLVVEKVKLFQYYLENNQLPPGNHIFK